MVHHLYWVWLLAANAFAQFPPISNPISMPDFQGTLSTSSLRCSHHATLSVVATSSTSAGSSSQVYVAGKFNQCCLSPSVSLATLNPDITYDATS